MKPASLRLALLLSVALNLGVIATVPSTACALPLRNPSRRFIRCWG